MFYYILILSWLEDELVFQILAAIEAKGFLKRRGYEHLLSTYYIPKH